MKRKIISLLLCAVMCMSVLCVPTFAAESTADFHTANKVLMQLGFVSDMSNEQTNFISRGDFTATLLKIMNIKASNQTAPFTDIDEFHEYYLTMSAAYNVGIINSSLARPDDKITYNEAVKMLVCMLGYDSYAAQRGGYPSGYIKVADDIDILDGVAVYDAPLVVRDETCLIFNAISAYVMEITGINDSVIYEIKQGKTILDQLYNIKCSSGLCEGVSDKKLYANDDILDGYVKINGYTYRMALDSMSDYVGMNIRFYYDADTNEVVACYPDTGRVLSLMTESIYDCKDRVLTYENADGAEQSVKLSSDVIILYNNFPADSFDTSLFVNVDGEATLIDRDEDGRYDCLFVDVTEDYVVKTVDSTYGIVYDLYTPGKSVQVNENAQTSVTFEDEYGNQMFVGELLRYDVISVKKSLDGKYVRAIYSGREVYGTVQSVEETDAKMFITINGRQYETTPDFKANETVSPGEAGVFAMNIMGKIATVNRAFSTTGDVKIGYFIDAACTSQFNGEYSYKILTASGDVMVYEPAERLRLDGDSCRKNEAYDKITHTGEAVSQPVRYSLDASGKLSLMDTLTLGGEEGKDTMKKMYSCYYDKFGNLRGTPELLEYRSGTGIFGSKIATDSATIVFAVPDTKTGNDDDYVVYDMSYFAGNEDYSFEAYKAVDESLIANVLTIKNTGADKQLSDKNAISVVVSQSYVIDDEGDSFVKLTLMNKDGMFDYFVQDTSVLSNVKKLTDSSAVHTLQNGDTVRVVYSGEKRIISDIELIYDRENDKFKYPANYNDAAANAQYRVSLNEIYSMYSGFILVAKGDIASGSTLDYDSLECYPASSFSIIVYDSTSTAENKVSVGRLSDLVDYQTAGKGSKIVLYTRYTGSGIIVVYK